MNVSTHSSTGTWHILDAGSIWMKEFAHALASLENVAAWEPRMQRLAFLPERTQTEYLPDPGLTLLRFPLQRGYARPPLCWIAPFQFALIRRLKAHAPHADISPLICTTPFYAPVAELWPGPVIYYVTDLTVAYDGLNPTQVKALDRRMCARATAVCPNSSRIADYLIRDATCDPARITIIPNATRASNIPSTPQLDPGPLPPDVLDLPRPIAGILGDLSGNMDWELLASAIRRTPAFSWLFVGPTTRAITDAKQNAARQWAMRHARFVGAKPYAQLQSYARALDVAILPYRKKEPTYSGSSTRYYEHLAAGRPMIATRGFAELLDKEPILTLVDTGDELAAALESLRAVQFRDGYETVRWHASQRGTWHERARAMRRALHSALPATVAEPASTHSRVTS